MDVISALQMTDAPSDGFSAGEWCDAAGVLAQAVARVDAVLRDPALSHRMVTRKEIGAALWDRGPSLAGPV